MPQVPLPTDDAAGWAELALGGRVVRVGTPGEYSSGYQWQRMRTDSKGKRFVHSVAPATAIEYRMWLLLQYPHSAWGDLDLSKMAPWYPGAVDPFVDVEAERILAAEFETERIRMEMRQIMAGRPSWETDIEISPQRLASIGDPFNAQLPSDEEEVEVWDVDEDDDADSWGGGVPQWDEAIAIVDSEFRQSAKAAHPAGKGNLPEWNPGEMRDAAALRIVDRGEDK